ncbi:TIGR03960 family B12-binding radical SAM protein [Proteinivorax hydrogeniformans]|uniref:TIGR03960 family B12-binding radical SAM protein n=1 Tax=Proteinivorax hydrogeniformans TaxID=1826727 RepID=A0AAU8HWM1_9FIRM
MNGIDINKYKQLLHEVEKPSRYTGSELNSVKKKWTEMDLNVLLAFPDIYEVSMSHLGFKILYHLINSQENYWAQRVNTPWIDYEQKLKDSNIPLSSLEEFRPIAEFDVIGFTLQYEMSYTNILNMLSLGSIPVKSQDRTKDHPLVIAGGPCAFNPEPLHQFIDAFIIGEGEEVTLEVLDLISNWKKEEVSKEDLLLRLSKLDGVYVPSLYKEIKNNNEFGGLKPVKEDIPDVITKRIVRDMDKSPFPTELIVPFMEIVHDRVMLEICRGCTRGCRFCQAGMLYRPVREKSTDVLVNQAEKLIQNTGYGEISLSSLSSADHSEINHMVKKLMESHSKQNVGVSLPSLRVDSFSIQLAEMVQQVRKTGLTFAPEAGTQRLRDVINKNVSEKNLIDAVSEAFSSGWHKVKLYFMIGLPTETYEDLDGIADLAFKVIKAYKDVHGKKGKLKVTVSTSSFVPKAHTPFQWLPQMSQEELANRQDYLKEKLRSKQITYNWHDTRTSFIEAAFARGDRRVSDVLYNAWNKGCKLDGWDNHFDYEKWISSFAKEDLDPKRYAYALWDTDAVLPWDHISSGVNKKYLKTEYKKAYEQMITEDCSFDKCSGCGICKNLGYDSAKVRRDSNG